MSVQQLMPAATVQMDAMFRCRDFVALVPGPSCQARLVFSPSDPKVHFLSCAHGSQQAQREQSSLHNLESAALRINTHRRLGRFFWPRSGCQPYSYMRREAVMEVFF